MCLDKKFLLMKPFNVFLSVAVIGMLLHLVSPVFYLTGFSAVSVTRYLLPAEGCCAAVVSFSLFYMMRLFQERTWVRNGFLVIAAARLLTALLYLPFGNPSGGLDMGALMRGAFILLGLVSAVWIIISCFSVQSAEIRPGFRTLGWCYIVSMGLLMMIPAMRELSHGSGVWYSVASSLAELPVQLVAVYLNYRFWNGTLGQQTELQKDVEALGS
jgi:hypothetical protein